MQYVCLPLGYKEPVAYMMAWLDPIWLAKHILQLLCTT